MNMMTELDELEAESIYILREVAAQFQRPALLFSGGKDSIVMLQLALKAFAPFPLPFPLLHIDTGHNFPETLHFRDKKVAETGVELRVRYVEDSIQKYGLEEPKERFVGRNALQTFTLLDAIQELGLDACIGGGRRDEEKARAKERIFSVRNAAGQWEPRLQRPELWSILNGSLPKDASMRVFPLSNWTELDVWQYILREGIEVPSIYFSHERDCIQLPASELLIAVSPYTQPQAGDRLLRTKVRYRTVGDMSCTAALRSEAQNVAEIIQELKNSRLSERGESRLDDKRSSSAMEDRKKMGYF